MTTASAQRVLVTGATGYIGSQLAKRLCREGCTVHVLTRRPSIVKVHLEIPDKQIHVYDGSLNCVSACLLASKPSVVFHLASLFIAEHQKNQVDDLISSNILFGTQLIDACAEANVKNFINTGTSWQHYRGNGYDPVCLYAATKQAFEDILDFYADSYLMRIVTLKLFDVYGPNDPRPKLVNFLLKALTTGERLEMSPGEQSLDLVHIEDVTNAYIRCATELEKITGLGSHSRYAISSGGCVSVKSLAARVEILSKRSLNASFGSRPYRHREVMSPWRDFNRCDWWKPEIDLDEGLRGLLSPFHVQDREYFD